MKGTDRRTSLLAFVTAALLARGEANVGSLPTQLSSIRPAANLQVPFPSLLYTDVSQIVLQVAHVGSLSTQLTSIRPAASRCVLVETY